LSRNKLFLKKKGENWGKIRGAQVNQNMPIDTQGCTRNRPREFVLAFKKDSYNPAAPPSTPNASANANASASASAPPAKRPRLTREEETPPSPGRVRSTIIFTQKYRFGATIHKYSVGFMYGI
jgi:hypothetical protein